MRKILSKITICIMAAVMLLVSVLFAGCTNWISSYEWSEDSFSLQIVADRADVKLGEEITITVTFRNLSGRNLHVYVKSPPPHPWTHNRRQGRQNGRNENFNSAALLLSHSDVASTLFEIPEYSIWGNPNLNQQMEYYRRYRLGKDLVIKKSLTFTFVESCDIVKNNDLKIAIPKEYIYGIAHVSFFTSHNMRPTTRVLINNCIQFNIIA